MVLNATFNNISVISWRSVLLVEKNRNTWKISPTCRKSLIKIVSDLHHDVTEILLKVALNNIPPLICEGL
jgi:transcriptional regulator